MELNKEQLEAVEHGEGCCVVISTAGSGKTRVITSRVIRLIEQGTSPENILCLTFTNKAADEMRERISAQISGANKVWISTFHKLCVAILRKFGNRIGISSEFTILPASDQEDLIKKIARIYDYEFTPGDISRLCTLVNNQRESLTPFSEFADEVMDEYARGDQFVQVIQEYINSLRDCNLVDFSGILSETHRLFTECPSVVETLSDKFKYILVDEYQDTNIVQYEIIKTLTKKNENLFAVGDHSQALYEFRGACPENLLKIIDDFPNCKKVVLPKNYRSGAKMLRMAQRLIRNNKTSRDVVLECTRGVEGSVEINEFNSPEDEADYVCEKIHELHSRGTPYSECAVLYRTNSLSKTIEQKCREHDIPYKIVGGFSFYERKEIKDVLSYLSFSVNPRDSIAFHRAVSTPKRGIGDAAIGKIEKFCKEKNVSVMEAMTDHLGEIDLSDKHRCALSKFAKLFTDAPQNVFEAATYFINEGGYLKHLEDLPDDKISDNRLSNVEELLNGISQFSKQVGSNTNEFLQHIFLQNIEKEDESDAVRLTSIHSSKGLEFCSVWIISVEENLLPHFLAMNEEKGEQSERMILYVGMTRSKDHLFISHCRYRKKFDFRSSQSRFVKARPSRFLYEIGEIEECD